jgi:hypothetical protein
MGVVKQGGMRYKHRSKRLRRLRRRTRKLGQQEHLSMKAQINK